MKTIAIVGGGRWARVYLSVLSSLNLPYRVIVVSSSNVSSIGKYCSSRDLCIPVALSVEELIEKYSPTAAIIVNSARMHVETACQLLEAGVPILVEKPIALNIKQLENLFDKGTYHNTYISPALTYLSCSYLHHFSKKINEHKDNISNITLEWSDPKAEVRYGVTKSYDPGISMAQDIMPHVWSIFASILNKTKACATVKSCSINHGGRQANFGFLFSGVSCHAHLKRDSQSRKRLLIVEFELGDSLKLDFTKEPGIISINSNSSSADPNWSSRTVKPIQQQIETFIHRIEENSQGSMAKLIATESTSLVEQADLYLKFQQKSWLAENSNNRNEDDLIYAITELLSFEFYSRRLVRPGDSSTLEFQTRDYINFLIENRLKSDNWLTLIERLKNIYFSSNQLKS